MRMLLSCFRIVISVVSAPLLAEVFLSPSTAYGGEPSVATIGSHVISRLSIACPHALAVAKDENAREQCRKVEEARFEVAARIALIELAAALNGVSPTPEEITRRTPVVDIAAVAARQKAVVEAALKLMRGGDPAEVERTLLRPHKIDSSEIEALRAMGVTERQLEDSLLLDYAQALREQHRTQARQALAVRKLEALIESRSAHEKRPPRDVESDLWKAVLARGPIEILDGRFKLPDMDGLLSKKMEAPDAPVAAQSSPSATAAPVKTRPPVSIDDVHYRTPQEQWAAAQKALRDYRDAKVPEEMTKAALTATALLEVIVTTWPEDEDYVTAAAATASQIYLSQSGQSNALEILDRALGLVKKNESLALLHLRRCEVLRALSRFGDAATEISKAERLLPAKWDELAAAVTRNAAEMYERQGRFSEAAERYLKLAQDPVSTDSSAAMFYLRSARASIGANDKEAARAALDALDVRIDKAKRSGAVSAGVAKMQDDVRQEAEDLRKRYGL